VLTTFRLPAALVGLAAIAELMMQVETTGIHASDLTITRVDDPTPDGCAIDDCSLREAIIAANTEAGANTIHVRPGTYTLSIQGRYDDAAARGDLDITDDLILAGSAREASVVTAGGSAAAIEDRVFDVMSGVSAQLERLTIRDAFFHFPPHDCGGGIRNRGDLILADVLVANNVMRGDGGGICNEGTLRVADSIISGNCACLAGRGGGLFSAGTTEVVDTTISRNIADFAGGGVGGSNITIRSSLITDNEIRYGTGGGGVSIDNSGTIINTTISGNRSTIQFGNLGLGLGGGPVADAVKVTGCIAAKVVGQIGTRSWRLWATMVAPRRPTHCSTAARLSTRAITTLARGRISAGPRGLWMVTGTDWRSVT